MTSILSKTGATSSMVLPQPETAKPTLPPELVLVIIELLSRQDQQTFCLISQTYRQLALPARFRKLRFSWNVPYRIKTFNEARGDVKAAVKELALDGYFKYWHYESILFPFLRSLPNLQSFRWRHPERFSRCDQAFFLLVASLQHRPLEHFAYWGPHVPEEQVVTAPSRLKSLSVKSHKVQLYDFVRPSFSTLVELELYPDSINFDLIPLRPVSGTLRKFAYRVDGFDPDILDTIPDVFPHLTTLGLMFQNATQDFLWKKSCDDVLAKNTKLQYLVVCAPRFTFCDRRPLCDLGECKKCRNQRVEATRALAMACTELKHCRWLTISAEYRFDVRLSGKSSETNTLIRVKRAAVTDLYSPLPFSFC